MKNSNICTEDNVAEIIGRPNRIFVLSHEIHGIKYYSTYVVVKRKSGTEDNIPVMVSEENLSYFYQSDYIYLKGQFKSYNDKRNGNLVLYLFCEDMENLYSEDVSEETNTIELNGYVCKPPVFRCTPGKREITDVMLAINRRFGKSDYIPCIFWGWDAQEAFKYKVGDNVRIRGRIQSRQYNKKISENVYEVKTAYEVSVVDIL